MKKLLLVLLMYQSAAVAQKDTSLKKPVEPAVAKPRPKWYETISLRGYMQVRYNRLLETNSELQCEQCDRSWGGNGGLFIRRARLVFFGQLHERLYFYFQPDFATAVSGTNQNFAQIRDAYVDLGIDRKNEYRIRIGQSKIPYGFENMQSSQNRLPLDRADALNSSIANERDLGAMFYWAPQETRKLFSSLVSEGLKGSGDYGVVGFGVFNGQTNNKPEQNKNLHVVGRVTYPMELGRQLIEPSIQAYTGKYFITKDQLSPGTKIKTGNNYDDQRIAGSFVLYPKPFGIQAEYNWGKGPEFNTATDSIETRPLSGGYATFSYLLRAKEQVIIPFVRVQTYTGGKKHELDARSYDMDELEFGLEWQPFRNFELVTMYTLSRRRFEDFGKQDNFQEGRLLRLQVQVNF